MYYCSVKMILFRPFCCDIQIEGESRESADFNQIGAQRCVNAAIYMLDLMPDNPIAEKVLQVLPWWTILHYICQATAILLLELCLSMLHMQDDPFKLWLALRKGLRYLWALSPGSKSAYRAWRIFRLLVGKAVQMYSHDVFKDVPTDAPTPPGWDDIDEENLIGITTQSLEEIIAQTAQPT